MSARREDFTTAQVHAEVDRLNGREHVCACAPCRAVKRQALTLARERDEARAALKNALAWIDDSVSACAKRQCSTRDRRRAESEAECESLRAQLAGLCETAAEVVAGVDKWNSQVQPIIGRRVDYDWGGLERLRVALAKAGKS